VTDIFETAAIKASGIQIDSPLADILSGRSDILTMTQQAHDAALKPDEPGGLSHKMRAALSCRMARLNQEEPLAAHFATLMDSANGPTEINQIADPNFDGGSHAWLSAILRHTDLVTTDTKAVVAGDIPTLIDADVSEDDIVRLSELIAFLSHQIRLTIGLRLIGNAE